MKALTYYSPAGNPEIYHMGEQPEGYLTETEWLAAHPDPEPAPLDPEAERLARIEAIKAVLAEIDFESIRPLRAIDNGTDTVDDHKKLVELEARAAALRVELEGLNG